MPGYDGTGPKGMGQQTGWGQGFCAPNIGPAAEGGYARFGRGRGGAPWGGGRGRCRGGGSRGGWGQRWGAEAPAWGGSPPGRNPQEEAASLKARASFLEQQLQEIQGRLARQEQEAGADKEKQ